MACIIEESISDTDSAITLKKYYSTESDVKKVSAILVKGAHSFVLRLLL